jgi:hypothetical protein
MGNTRYGKRELDKEELSDTKFVYVDYRHLKCDCCQLM